MTIAPSWPRPLRGALLDLDGTLVDTEPWHVESAAAVLAELGHRLPTEDLRRFAGAADPEFWAALRPRLGFALDVPELMRRRTRALCARLRTATLTPLPGVLELLDLLDAAALPAAVASSSPQAQIAAILAAAGLADRLRLRLSAVEDVARFKPWPDVFLAAAARLGAAPRHCLAIEDSGRGVAAAAAAGCFVVWVPPPGPAGAPPDGAHLRLRSLVELVPQLRQALTT